MPHAFWLGLTSNPCFQRLFPTHMCSNIVKMCPKFAQICYAFWFEFGYVLCVLLWKTTEYGKTHNFWHPFPYFRMGIDSDAKIDPKFAYFRHIPIIYTQTGVASVFCVSPGAFLLESRFAHGFLLFCCFPCGFWFEMENLPRARKSPMGLNLENKTLPGLYGSFVGVLLWITSRLDCLPGLLARPALKN